TLLGGPFETPAFPEGFTVGAPPMGAPVMASVRERALGVSAVIALCPGAAAAAGGRCCSPRIEPRFACHVLECCSGGCCPRCGWACRCCFCNDWQQLMPGGFRVRTDGPPEDAVELPPRIDLSVDPHELQLLLLLLLLSLLLLEQPVLGLLLLFVGLLEV